MSDLARVAEQFCRSHKDQWSTLCDVACSIGPKRFDKAAQFLSTHSGASRKAVLQKLRAIQSLRESGKTCEEIKVAGQGAALSQHAQARKKERGPQRFVKWRIDADLADAVEQTFWRIGKVLKIRESTMAWEYVNSVLSGLSDAELRHFAGEVLVKKKHKA